MSPYERLLGLALEQHEAVTRGDYVRAVALLDARAVLLDAAPPLTPSDAETVREILRLDQALGEAFGAEAQRLRAQASQSQRRKDVLAHYRSARQAAPALIDSAR